MGRALRILALGVGGTLLVLLLIAAAFLVEAHIEIGRVTPPLPEWMALDGELAVAPHGLSHAPHGHAHAGGGMCVGRRRDMPAGLA